jgi:3-methyladenine DNA glycosylase/8-oxoguanine DNA glycosylase
MRHLIARDQRFKPIIERAGPCPLVPRPPRQRFAMLVRSIVHQQISMKAGASIDARLLELQGVDWHVPERILELGEERIRPAGLSANKARSIIDLAAHVDDGRLPLARIARYDDETVIERLTAVRGIGRWTAEMFLVFGLARPDVLSVGDLGIRQGMRLHFGLEEAPKPSDCETLGETWRPFRTLAMWYLWRHVEAARSIEKKDATRKPVQE